MSHDPKDDTQIALEQEAANLNTSLDRLAELAFSDVKLGRIVAENASAAPELLEELSESADEKTRLAVVSNPNTPIDILFELGEEFPEQLLNNPILTLLQLENRDFIQDIRTEHLITFLKYSQTPEWLLKLATNINDYVVLRTLLMHPKTPKTALEKLIRDGENYIATEARLHVNWAGEIDTGWSEAAQSEIASIDDLGDSVDEILFLGNIGILPEYLLQAEDLCKKYKAALNSQTPVSILEELVGHFSDWVRDAAVKNINTSLDVIRLYRSQETAIANLKTTAEELTQLATSRWSYIRQGVALHPNTAVEVLEQLARDDNTNVRKSSALNINTPIPVLEELAEFFPDFVAVHPYCPSTLLEKIYQTGQSYSIIALHPNTSDRVLKELALGSYKYQVAKNHKTPREVLAQLAQDPDPFVRSLVVENPNTPPQVLSVLEKDPSQQVLNARNNKHNCQKTADAVPLDYEPISKLVFKFPETLKTKVQDLADSINIPNLSLQTWTQSWSSEPTLLNLETIAVNSIERQTEFERVKIAINPDTPHSILEKLAVDTSEEVRHAVAININTPASILEQLATLCDPRIASIVARHPNTNAKTLAQLLARQYHVRDLVALRHDTPTQQLKQFLQDYDRSVRYTAMRTCEQIASQNNTLEDIVKEWKVVQNPNTPTKELARLATSQWAIVREAIALHRKVDIQILTQLASDPHVCVRCAVAMNSNTSIKLLQQLADDKEKSVQIAVANNPRTPLKIMYKLVERYDSLGNDSLGEICLTALTSLIKQHPRQMGQYLSLLVNKIYAIPTLSTLTKFAVFLHPLTPASLLSADSDSIYWWERYAIAQNPNTPKHTLKKLIQDGNRFVRAAASRF